MKGRAPGGHLRGPPLQLLGRLQGPGHVEHFVVGPGGKTQLRHGALQSGRSGTRCLTRVGNRGRESSGTSCLTYLTPRMRCSESPDTFTPTG